MPQWLSCRTVLRKTVTAIVYSARNEIRARESHDLQIPIPA
jgi:hypothetical protein